LHRPIRLELVQLYWNLLWTTLFNPIKIGDLTLANRVIIGAADALRAPPVKGVCRMR